MPIDDLPAILRDLADAVQILAALVPRMQDARDVMMVERATVRAVFAMRRLQPKAE